MQSILTKKRLPNARCIAYSGHFLFADNGFTFDGPMFNIYHVSPHETANPEEYVTEVCYPVRKA